MAENKPLKKDLKEVIKEMSKAPGGNVAMSRPVTPGGVQGGPPTVPSPVLGATQQEPEGPLVKRDIARESFRAFKTGEVRQENIPAPAPDTKKVEVTKVKPTGKKGFKGTQEQQDVAQGVREGTMRGMTRAPGSKPSLAKSLPMAIEIAAERARRKTERETIQESLRQASGSIVSREEQNLIDRAAQAARDALLDREASIKEAAMLRDAGTGEVNPLAQSVTQSEADRRALEGMKEFEKLSKQNTVKISGGNAGKGTPMGDAKDVAMRKIANAAIVELQDISRQAQITNAQPEAIGKTSSETSLLKLGPATGNLSGKTIMLARNGKLANTPLRPETVNQITAAAQAGAKFVVGDMPGVDSEFIKLLDKLNAPYKIYHTGEKPRVQINKSISKTPPIIGGKGTAAFGLLGLGADAILLWRQLLQQAELTNQLLQNEAMN